MFSEIWFRLKEMIRRMIGARTVEQKLHVAPIISSQMETSIKLWTDMYQDKASWLHEPSNVDPSRVVSLGLPSLIASEMARTALIEFKSDITTPTTDVEVKNPRYTKPEPDEYGNVMPTAEPEFIVQKKPKSSVKRAEYLDKEYKKLKKKLRTEVEYGIAKGGLVIKPYVILNTAKAENGTSTYPEAEIEFDYVQADRFYPLAYDANKRITEAAFLETKTDKQTVYRRLEYHKWENNTVKVMNMAFKSLNNERGGDMAGVDLGQEIDLKEVPEWANLPKQTTIKDVDCPLFAYFKMPQANTIDLESPLGVSGYSRAVSLIKDADMQYSRLLWEYEGGELAIDIDRDALRLDIDEKGNDRTVLSKLQQRLYRKIDISQTGETYQQYAPTLRDTSYNQGLNTILMRIEDTCALSRGTLSDATQEAKTATELKILKQRSYQANADIQQSLEDTLKQVIHIMDMYCDLYSITVDGEYDVNFEWDDSIIVDVDMELQKRLTLQQNGLASKIENRMWYFGETEEQAREALQKIEEESNQDAERELTMQANMIRTENEISNQNKPQDEKK